MKPYRTSKTRLCETYLKNFLDDEGVQQNYTHTTDQPCPKVISYYATLGNLQKS